MILNEVKGYYKQNCINQLLGPNASAQLSKAQTALTATLAAPQTEFTSALIPKATNTFVNYFPEAPAQGSHTDMVHNFQPSISVTTVGSTLSNRFNQTWLWHVNVSACINPGYFNGLSNSQIEGLFQANDAQEGQENCSGLELTWTSLPRYSAGRMSSNLSLMKTNLTQYTRQYQFGEWMRNAEYMKRVGLNQQDFNYLCQI